MKENKKKYDAVQEMIDIREKLSLKYWNHTDVLLKDMKAIREKYNLQIKDPQTHSK